MNPQHTLDRPILKNKYPRNKNLPHHSQNYPFQLLAETDLWTTRVSI